MVEFLTSYGWIIPIAIVIIAFIIIAIIDPKKAKNWLKLAVIEAEKTLGDGTGIVKLLRVYNFFIEKFPILATFISFKRFSKWVDIALDWMRETLENNEKIAEMVKVNEVSL